MSLTGRAQHHITVLRIKYPHVHNVYCVKTTYKLIQNTAEVAAGLQLIAVRPHISSLKIVH